MSNPSVTYTGEEVALIAAFITVALPALDPADYEVADLLLERALAAFPDALSPEVAQRVDRYRKRPG